jgi:hypothetical protein
MENPDTDTQGTVRAACDNKDPVADERIVRPSTSYTLVVLMFCVRVGSSAADPLDRCPRPVKIATAPWRNHGLFDPQTVAPAQQDCPYGGMPSA